MRQSEPHSYRGTDHGSTFFFLVAERLEDVPAAHRETPTGATERPPGSGTPTGTVSFYDGGTLLGTSTLSGGAATLTVAKLSAGTHAIAVRYNSDPNFLASLSDPFTQTVRSAAEQVALLSGQVNELVKSGVLSSQEANGLTPKLNAALASLNAGNATAGVNQLNAFINEVNTMLKRPTLTQEEALQFQALIDAATQAIASALA
jgi:Bacterial Ig-like domain (group 3)/FIMAH domain